MDDRTAGVLILSLFILYCLTLLSQEYGKTGNTETREQINKVTPAIYTTGAFLLVGGILYLNFRNGKSDYDIPMLTGYCFFIFVASILTFHASLYKVNLS